MSKKVTPVSVQGGDDLYPNDGKYFFPAEPEDQKEKREADNNEVASLLPTLKEIIDHLDKQIAHYESVNAFPKEILTKPDEFMHVVAGNQVAAANLKMERSWIQSKIDNLQP